jgi:hypothetical protein
MCPEIHNFKLSKCITVKYKNYLIQVGRGEGQYDRFHRIPHKNQHSQFIFWVPQVPRTSSQRIKNAARLKIKLLRQVNLQRVLNLVGQFLSCQTEYKYHTQQGVEESAESQRCDESHVVVILK